MKGGRDAPRGGCGYENAAAVGWLEVRDARVALKQRAALQSVLRGELDRGLQ
jgi:hypothetical protein